MKKYDVAICGFGPVGSICAILLAQYGHEVLVIEKNNGPCQTARAINTDGEQLRVFDKINIAEKIIKNSNQIEKVHFSDVNLKPIQSLTQSLDDTEMGWPNQVLFYQPELESFIRDKAKKLSNINVIESCELKDFNDEKGTVYISCKKGIRNIDFNSKFLVGCDGARSSIRKKLNITLDDFGYNQEWLVCDAHLTKNIHLKNELVQVCNPKRPCTFLHGRRGHLRFEFKVMPNDDLDKLRSNESVWNLLSPWIDKSNARLERAAIYNFHACIAKVWRMNNVLIAGDSAHQMPPFMGAGMGTGIRDVANLAWKINLILEKKAKKNILDTYQKERYSHAKWSIAQSITIGEIIEGFCAAEEGKKYKPKKRGYDVNFPHIPSGIYTNPTDNITGYQVPQPNVLVKKKIIRLDKLIKSKFSIITNTKITKINNKAKQIIKKLKIKIIHVSKIDDPEKRLKKIFDKYDYILVRPDLYVYGGANKEDLSNMIESLKDSFSLID